MIFAVKYGVGHSNGIYSGWFRNCRKLKDTCRWGYTLAWTLFVMKFSHHALVLSFLTQQDLRAVLVFANSSFFLISCFFIIIASLVRCICKYFWFSRKSVTKKKKIVGLSITPTKWNNSTEGYCRSLSYFL